MTDKAAHQSMLPFPSFSRGIGRLGAEHLNEIVRSIENPNPTIDVFEPPVVPFIMVSVVFTPRVNESQPLDREFSWSERGMSGPTGLFDVGLNQDSGTPEGDEFLRPAGFVTAPSIFLMSVKDDAGNLRFVYMPTTQTLLAEIITVTPDKNDENAQYELLTVDNTLRRDFASPPMDRWAGVNYTPRAIGDLMVILIPNSDILNMKYLAFETPTFATCPAPATAPTGGISVSSLMGI